MKALHKYTTFAPPAKTQGRAQMILWMRKKGRERCENTTQASQVEGTTKARAASPRNRPRPGCQSSRPIPESLAGAITPLAPLFCVLPPSLPRAVLICGMRRGLSSCVPSATLDGNGTCACARTSFRFLLFALLDDIVFAIIGGGNAEGGADSSGVAV